MNQPLSIQSGQGLLKDAYPDASRNQEAMQALRNRQRELQQRVQSQQSDPVQGQNVAAAFPTPGKPPGLQGSPGRLTPQGRKLPVR